MSSGLNPGLGIHHGSLGNPYPLVDDIMETFRPSVDAVVLGLIRSDSLIMSSAETRRALVAASTSKINPKGGAISSEITLLAQRLGQVLESGGLDVPVWYGTQ